MTMKRLSAKAPIRVQTVRQFHRTIGKGLVQRRTGDLDHLEAGRAFEHAMPDAGRLEDDVTGLHDKRLTLVLVDDLHPSASNTNKLQRDIMKMDPVCDRTALFNNDVRRDVTAAKTTWNEVAIQHAGAPLARSTA